MKGFEIPPQKTKGGRKILYHGAKKTFNEFKTPMGTEKMDVVKGGVIYLTSDIKRAKKYAGPNGYVCIAETDNPIPYKKQREKQDLPPKQKKYMRNVYVALPIDVNIKEFKRVSDIE